MLGIAFLMNKIEKGLDLGDRGISSINFYLDILDDRLLGELRGENQDFNRFTIEYKEAKHIWDSNKKFSALANLKGTVLSGIQQVNLKCNEAIQSTATGRGSLKGLIAIGLVEEGTAYRDAYLKGGWGELATEFFRRRVPFGSSVEQAMMGNYLNAGWEVITTLVPPVGLAQAAVGIGKYALYDMPLSYYWTEQLSVFVDSLYATATFKLIGVESYENAKVGVWRLVSAKYSGGVLNVEQFTKYKQEQIESMRQQLQKPLSQRKTDFKGLGFTDDKDIDNMLKKNIAATDAALNLIDEMTKNENVGDRLKQHYGDAYKTRWEEAKLNFVLNMIHQLEKRKAIDDALLRGVLPDMFAELVKIAKELKIEVALEKEMDKELNTNNLKAIFSWLWNMKRDFFSEGQMESDYTKAGEIVKRYLDAYKAIYEARQEAEVIFAAGRPEEHGKRILTGTDFLVAKPEDDKKTATQYYQLVTNTRDTVEKELLEIKTGCISGAKLDSEYDKKIFSNLIQDKVWQRLWSDLFKFKSDNIKDIDSRNDYPKWAKEHNEKSIAALKGYKEYYSKNCLLIAIEGDPEPPFITGQVAKLRVSMKLPEQSKKPPVFRYIWTDMKDLLRLGEQTDTLIVNTSTTGTFEIKAEVMKAEGNKWEKIGEATRKFEIYGKLKINIKAPEKASVGQTVDFSVTTEPDFPGAQALQYAWRMKGSTQVIDDKKSFSKRVDHPGTYEFSVVVYQNDMIKKQSIKLGEAKHTMVVSQGTTVDITGPAQISIGENVPFIAKVTKPESEGSGFAKAAGGIISSLGKQLFGKDIVGSGTQPAAQPYIFEWYVDGIRMGSSGNALAHVFAVKGNHTVKVIAHEEIEGKRQKVGEKTVTVVAKEAVEAGETSGGMCEVEQRYGNFVKARYDFFKGNVKDLGYPNWPQYLGFKTEYLKKMGHDPGEVRFEGRYEVTGTPIVLSPGRSPLYGGKYIGLAIYHIRISKLNGKDDQDYCSAPSSTMFLSERTQATTKTETGEALDYPADGGSTAVRWANNENLKKITMCHNYPEAFYDIKAGKDYYRVGDSYKNWNSYNKSNCSKLFFQERTTIEPHGHYRYGNTTIYEVYHQLHIVVRNINIYVHMTYSGVIGGYRSLKFNWSDLKDSVFAFVAKLPKKDPAVAEEANESSKEKQKKKK